jgi:hypothetical protein
MNLIHRINLKIPRKENHEIDFPNGNITLDKLCTHCDASVARQLY